MMIHLEQNIKGLCSKHDIHYDDFLSDLEVDDLNELTLYDLQAVAEEYKIDLMALLFKPLFHSDHLKKKIKELKLLILDVDGVMTDGGMYMTENGDQIKKFNTKDGLGIMSLIKTGFNVGIISSGFTQVMVQKRAEILGIERCYVGREPKLGILQGWCSELGIGLHQVAVIGDDINDLEIMKSVGLAACPADAMNDIKSTSHIVLSSNGGEGCVREFISSYLTPLQ